VRRNQPLFEAEGHTVARCNERISCPQGLKPGFIYGFIGTTEVVPFPNEVASFPDQVVVFSGEVVFPVVLQSGTDFCSPVRRFS
jgi:hypothetical protein